MASQPKTRSLQGFSPEYWPNFVELIERLQMLLTRTKDLIVPWVTSMAHVMNDQSLDTDAQAKETATIKLSEGYLHLVLLVS